MIRLHHARQPGGAEQGRGAASDIEAFGEVARVVATTGPNPVRRLFRSSCMGGHG